MDAWKKRPDLQKKLKEIGIEQAREIKELTNSR